MNDLNLYAKISKVNEEERIVEGYASSEDLDSDGEVITKEAMSNAIPEFMSLPGGGNLREMHQPKASGKIPFMKQDNEGRTFIRAKIVDNDAWEKIKEKVYTGFSIGGSALKKVGNTIKELRLSEISLVDRPANPKALFTMYKRDDSENIEEEVTVDEYKEMIVTAINTAGEQLNKRLKDK